MERGLKYQVPLVYLQQNKRSSLTPSLSQDAAVVWAEGLGGERSGRGERSSSFLPIALPVFMSVYSEDCLSTSKQLETGSLQMYVLSCFKHLLSVLAECLVTAWKMDMWNEDISPLTSTFAEGMSRIWGKGYGQAFKKVSPPFSFACLLEEQ